MKFEMALVICSRDSENTFTPIDSHNNFVFFASQKFKRLQFHFGVFKLVQTYIYAKVNT